MPSRQNPSGGGIGGWAPVDGQNFPLCRASPNALELTADGKVVLRLRRPWRDGTRALCFEPSELLEKLALEKLAVIGLHPNLEPLGHPFRSLGVQSTGVLYGRLRGSGSGEKTRGEPPLWSDE